MGTKTAYFQLLAEVFTHKSILRRRVQIGKISSVSNLPFLFFLGRIGGCLGVLPHIWTSAFVCCCIWCQMLGSCCKLLICTMVTDVTLHIVNGSFFFKS